MFGNPLKDWSPGLRFKGRFIRFWTKMGPKSRKERLTLKGVGS